MERGEGGVEVIQKLNFLEINHENIFRKKFLPAKISSLKVMFFFPIFTWISGIDQHCIVFFVQNPIHFEYLRGCLNETLRRVGK